MNETIESSVFGRLQLEDELPEHPAYTTELFVPGHGRASITLGLMPDDEPDWQRFLRGAEESFPLLLQHELAIRQQAAPQVLARHRDYYAGEWRGAALELVSDIRLSHLNFFSDGNFELWYSGGAPFRDRDIRINLDADMRITEVGTDG